MTHRATPLYPCDACSPVAIVYTQALLVFHWSRLTPTHFCFSSCQFIDVSVYYIRRVHCWSMQYITLYAWRGWVGRNIILPISRIWRRESIDQSIFVILMIIVKVKYRIIKSFRTQILSYLLFCLSAFVSSLPDKLVILIRFSNQSVHLSWYRVKWRSLKRRIKTISLFVTKWIISDSVQSLKIFNSVMFSWSPEVQRQKSQFLFFSVIFFHLFYSLKIANLKKNKKIKTIKRKKKNNSKENE